MLLSLMKVLMLFKIIRVDPNVFVFIRLKYYFDGRFIFRLILCTFTCLRFISVILNRMWLTLEESGSNNTYLEYF